MKKNFLTPKLLWPRPSYLLIFLFLIVLSTLVTTKRVATTKVTWEESRGIPFTVVTITEIAFGPCSIGSADCKRDIENVFVLNFLINAVCIYLFVLLNGYVSNKFISFLYPHDRVKR
jgi:hypothetical protein